MLEQVGWLNKSTGGLAESQSIYGFILAHGGADDVEPRNYELAIQAAIACQITAPAHCCGAPRIPQLDGR